MKKILFLFVTISVFTTAVVEAQSKKELKEQKRQEEYKATKTLIESGVFRFNTKSANTQKGRRIDLTTNSGSFVINKGNAIADLPYFGVSQISGYSGNAGIVFDNKDVEYTIEYNDKKRKITIKFKASNDSETFDVFLSIFGAGNSTLNISSSHRNHISYSGDIIELKQAE